MEYEIVGFCTRCFKRHSGKCVALGVAASLAFGPVIASAKDGQPHGQVRPVVVFTATTTGGTTSLDSTVYISGPSPVVAGPQ